MTFFNANAYVGDLCPTCTARPCVSIDQADDPPLFYACKLQWRHDGFPKKPRYARVHARVGDILAWDVKATQGFSLNTLREMVRGHINESDIGRRAKSLVEYIDGVIRRREHITGDV